MLAPFIRFVGGKRWLAKQLAAEIEAVEPKLYMEPFLGGGAVALAIRSNIPKVLSDINPTLIDVWRCLQRAPAALIEELGRIEHEFDNDSLGYAQARIELNCAINAQRPMWIRRSALFLYINARCFNGIWRTNSKGHFNVPYGKLESPSSIDFEEAQHYCHFLQKVKIFDGDFRFHLESAYQLDKVAIYADPPYDGTFDGYAKDGFDEQRELAEMLRYLATRGAKIWTTNSDTELIREIYSWARIESLEEHHSVGATGERRGKRSCLLIRGG